MTNISWNPPHNYHPNRKKIGKEKQGWYLIRTIRENSVEFSQVMSKYQTVCNDLGIELTTGQAYGQTENDIMPGFVNVYCTALYRTVNGDQHIDMLPFWVKLEKL